MLNFLYLYLKLINFWFLSFESIIRVCKINKRYSNLFLIGTVPVIQPVSSNIDLIIWGYNLNIWSIFIGGTLIFLIVGGLIVTVVNSKIVTECISNTYSFFLCYLFWLFKDQIFPNLGDKWVKKLQDLKTKIVTDGASNFLLLDICYKNPTLFIICIGMLIIPLSFFIYSILTAVSFIDQYNLEISRNVTYWTNILVLGILSQFHIALTGVDTLFFSDGLSLWLLNLHKRLWLSSISIVILLYYFSVFYRIMNSYGYLSHITLIMTRMFEKYTVYIWKKRMFALLISSTIYVVVVLYGPEWSYPFNLLVDWVELVAIFSFFIFSWEVPSFGFFGAILGGNTVARSGSVEGTPKIIGKVKPNIVEKTKPYFMYSKGSTPLERRQNAMWRAQYLRKNFVVQPGLPSRVVKLESEIIKLKSENIVLNSKVAKLEKPEELSKFKAVTKMVGDVGKGVVTGGVAFEIVDNVIGDGTRTAKFNQKLGTVVKKSADKLVDVLPEVKGHSEPKMP